MYITTLALCYQMSVHKRRISFLLICIPLALSAFIHLWNTAGFPTFHLDEHTYMARAVNVLHGNGPFIADYNHPYDHPVFGQLFLAGLFTIIGYPDLLIPTEDNAQSVEMLLGVPRVLMGLLAVVDTFLVYKIAETRYDRKVAFTSSILFAVMPITWLTERIYLDNLFLPLVLTGILFALYNTHSKKIVAGRTFISILISGIFLGLAIFTKIPAFTFIPVIAFLVLVTTNRSFRALLLWFIPVLSIPAVWPAYAISIGEFEQWKDDLFWQARERQDQPLIYRLNDFLIVDPVLFLVGLAGIVYATIKKDHLLLMCIVPYLAFLYMIGFVSNFHIIPLVPFFCIAAGRLISALLSRFREKKIPNIISLGVASGIIVFGLWSNILLTATTNNSALFETIAIISKNLPDKKQTTHLQDRVSVLSAGSTRYVWIPQYVFQKDDHIYQNIYSKNKVETEKVLLIVDRSFMRFMSEVSDERGQQLQRLYNNSDAIALVNDRTNTTENPMQYPYTSMLWNPSIGRIEIRVAYNDAT